MEYNRTYWQAREGTKLNKFTKVNETTSTVELVNAPDAITVEGTEVTTARLNNMESGISGAVAGVNEIQGVVDFTDILIPFSGLGQTSRSWYGMTTRSGDVYACVFDGDIYKQTGGVGDFIALGQPTRSWRGMTTLGNDIYASVRNGDIYKQIGGEGDFIALGQTPRLWFGMTTLGNDVYACVSGGDIYKQTGGEGGFIALGQTSINWFGMTTLGNDVYASVSGGDIYKQTGGVGDFIALGQPTRSWLGMTTLGNDVYACVSNGDIYKQTGGVGDFISLGQPTRFWYGMTTLGNDIYASVYNGDIYKQTVLTGNTYRASSSFTLPAMPDGARKRILNTHETTAITVTAYSGTTIEGQATMTLSAGHEVELELIGTDWRKVVLSQSATPEAGKAMVWPDPPILDADLFRGIPLSNFIFGANETGTTGTPDCNSIDKSGFFTTQSPWTNAPTSSVYLILSLVYIDGHSKKQLAFEYIGSALYTRGYTNGTWSAWEKVWNAGNDGSGSGLETDKIPFATKTGASTGSQGQASFDASYLYLCTATNVWKRVALTSF